MEFTLYSVGDSAFLEQILISVAMVTGSGDFSKMASVGLLLSVLFVCVQSLVQGARGIEFQQVLFGWLVYACLFYPSTTVVVEDAYDGNTRVVDNVPLGVGAAGGIISQIGYKLTDMFEVGYGYYAPTLTSSYFAESLEILNGMRSRFQNSAVFTAANTVLSSGAGDFRKSWNTYIRECTLTKIDLGFASVDDVANAPIMEALRFDSRIYGTRLYLYDRVGTDYDCTDAYNELENATQMVVQSQELNTALTNLLQINTVTGASAVSKLSDSLQALGAVTVNGYDYMKAALLDPVYADAVVGRYQDLQDYSSALMVRQAIQQRNTQWAAEQSMFLNVARPMQTFFEGLVYAITPLLAFMLVMGRFGVSLAAKYLQTLFWIQLWLPILSIINLFILTAASRKLGSYGASELNSMYALYGADEIIQTWIATGGMLAAATPVISLFVVTGSSYAMTSIAGRLNGGDHLNEKIDTPDVVQPAAYMQAQPMHGWDAYRGTLQSGTDGLLGSMSLGSTIRSGISSASMRQEQASQAFTEQLGRTFSDSASSEQMMSNLSSLGRTVGSMNTQQSGMVEKASKDFSEKFGVGASDRDAVRGAFTLAITGDAGAQLTAKRGLSQIVSKAQGDEGKAKGTDFGINGSVGVSGGAKGISESSGEDSTSTTAEQVNNYLEGLAYQKNDSAQLTNQLAQQFSASGGSSWKTGLSDTQSTALSKLGSNLLSASENFSTVNELADSVSTTTNSDYRTLGAAIEHSPAAENLLNEHMRYAPSAVRQNAVNLENQFKSYGMNPHVARNAAQLAALANTSNYAPGSEASGVQAALAVANLATSSNAGVEADPYRNSAIHAPEVEGVRDRVSAQVGSGGRAAAGVRSESVPHARLDPAQMLGALPETSSIAESNYQTSQAQLENQANRADQQRSEPQLARARHDLSQVAERGLRKSTWFWGRMDNANNYLKEEGSRIIGGLAEAASAMNGALGSAKIEGFSDLINVAKVASGKGDQAASDFYAQHGQVFTEKLTQAATLRYNLTPAQAGVYASEFGLSTISRDQAMEKLRMDYADRDQDGSVILQQGKPQLSAENEKMVTDMGEAISSAATAGDQAGAYLRPIQHINRLSTSVVDSANPSGR
ncbi:conjugal transfer protein TraG N-terminal domain-containing protein [Azomonas macrocytogenes]|uniref:Conjugal transfer mating pair stabilization protein TraG n=1 Tax=Azomonas macrocytogenes TaxID=69962 RepID=A0A839TCI9_AZOMA|nr:conjugal transfer mating pair stabilization protein TraG [Azomonas macrocytogenes]